MMHANWAHVVRGAAALAAAMGIGRFAYTPILPLMTAQANITPQLAGNLATANYVGYLAGALAGIASNRLARSAMALRVSLVVLVATLAAMPLASNAFGWLGLRAVAGFTSAVVFVIAVNSMLDHLGDHSPHLPGWGFGGVGVGIALSAVLVLAQPGAAGQGFRLDLDLALLVSDPALEARPDGNQHADKHAGKGDGGYDFARAHQILSSRPRSASIWWAMS